MYIADIREQSLHKISRSQVDMLIFYILLFGVVYLASCDFWQLIRSSSMSTSARSFVTSFPTMQPSCPGHHQWQELDLRLGPWDKAVISQRIGEQQSQEHAHHFIWHRSKGIGYGRPNSHFRMLLWRFMATAWPDGSTSPGNYGYGYMLDRPLHNIWSLYICFTGTMSNKLKDLQTALVPNLSLRHPISPRQ
jgi:hypothetical protein